MTRSSKFFPIREALGILFLKRMVLDGDRVLGIESLGQPMITITHPASGANENSMHLIERNLKVDYLERVKDQGLWSNLMKKLTTGSFISDTSENWVYHNHPFKDGAPTIKEIQLIHYD
jgi:hypothetical protein